MKKLIFIDHNFHIKTNSSKFFTKILRQNFIVKNYWVDKNLSFSKEILKFDNLLFWQIFPSINLLKKLKNKNIIWVPMYDSPMYPMGYSWLLWLIVKYYNIKVLSFSNAISKQIRNKKIKFLSIKYFEKSKNLKTKNQKITLFFWDRDQIKLHHWIDKFNLNDIKKIYCLNKENIHKDIIKDKVLSKKIKFIKKKFTKNNKDFLDLMRKSDVFITPRKKEGIGMSMIEALSFGKYIIAYNDSTMNEYVVNKKIGSFLNDRLSKQDIYENVLKFHDYRLKYNTKGYDNYCYNKKKIIPFVLKKQANFNKSLIFEFIILLMYYFKIVTRKVHLILKRI